MASDTGGRAMGTTLDYALGGMDARVTALEKRVAMIEREIKEELRALNGKNDQINAKIDDLSDTMIADRSGRKAIMWFVGIVATASTVVATLYQIGVIR